MANPEHLEKFHQGTVLWNFWRWDNPHIRPDLGGENFSKFNNFNREFVAEVAEYENYENKWGLQGAFKMARYDLRSVDFSFCNFMGADLSHAILDGADLSYTDITDVDFTGALLVGCDFYEATLCNTKFLAANMKGCLGLGTVLFEDVSFVDYRTCELSWPLPEAFLRGCGLPDNYIDYLPSLMNQPIQFYSCFISYADKNREFVDRLHNDMQGSGVRVWYAPEDLKTGDKLHPTFDRAIRFHDKLLIILSEQSLASPWVEDEVNRALAKERERKRKGDDSPVLFPIMIDDAVLESEEPWATFIKDNRYIGDFRAWKTHDSYRKAFDRLMRDLKPAIMRMPGA